MMKMDFINKSKVRKVVRSFSLLVFLLSISQIVSAQCSLACKGTINVSVGPDCSVQLTPDIILNGSSTSCPMSGTFSILLTASDGSPIPLDVDNIWTSAADYIHDKVSISITDPTSGNTCWGWANIEDKLPPRITAPNDSVSDVVSCCGDLIIDPGTSFAIPGSGSGSCATTGSGTTAFVVEECSEIEWRELTRLNFSYCDYLDANPALAADTCAEFSQVIRRELVAVDAWGRVSEDTLHHDIFVRRVNIGNEDNVICPADYKGAEALSCETLPEETILVEDVVVPAPTPKGGGIPSIIKDSGPMWLERDTLALHPLNAGDSLSIAVFQNCGISVRYDDRLIPKIGKCGGYTLVRNWTISEWLCYGQVDTVCTQIFELIDNDGPVVLEPVNDFEGSTNGYTCEGRVYVPMPVFQDKCSGIEQVDVTFPGGFISAYDTLADHERFITLPVGTNEVIFLAYDECHNASKPDTVIVDVWDKTPPVVICDEHTVVSLADKGNTGVPAKSFDGGSYDDCGIMEIYARRMDNSCGCTIPEYSTFGYIGEFEGSHYYLSNRPFGREIAFRKAAAMDASIFAFDTLADGTSAEKAYLDANLPSGIGDIIMDAEGNTVGNGRYIMEVSDLCQVFRETIDFCCEDPITQMITLRACDHQGNYNDCMFEVELQNKIPPKILQCPVDIMISCEVNFDVTDDDVMASIFGTLVREDEEVKTYHFVGDPSPVDGFFAVAIGNGPDTLCDGSDALPYEIWDGLYWDNCGGATISVDNRDERNKCGIDTIKRVFTLFSGNKEIETCTQNIVVKPEKPFDFNSIVMPLDTTMLACGFPEDYGPEVTGFPEIVEGQCDLVGFNYTDQTFLFNEYDEDNPACFKILRTWQFIDWCTFDGSTNQPYPMDPYEQIIKVQDKDAPEILFSCEERSECTYDPDCATGYIELLKTAVDGCTGSDHLRWEAEVYIDIKATENEIDTSYAGTGNLANASAHYPTGKHMVRWLFFDRCGNVTSCEQIFVIKNCKAATPYCIDGLVVDLMPVDEDGDGDPDSGMVELWASDFDLGSSHPCGYPVILSFSEDINDTNWTFDCDYQTRVDVRIYSSVIVGEGAHEEIVQSYCETHLNIQDNNRVCNGRGTISEVAFISGLISTELNQNIAQAEVNLDGSELAPAMTNGNGEYAFPEMPLGGAYVVAPKKDDDYINGVSTLDLVMIQKHILGLQQLDGPYKKIAADINKDQKITASDLVELRKLILGNVSELADNDSWRFIDNTYEFVNQENPLNEVIAEAYEIPSLDQDMKIDFTAVKVGDVNNSVAITNYQTTEVRSTNNLTLKTTPQTQGDKVRLPVTVSEANKISGLQFTLDYASTGLTFSSIEGGKLVLDNSNLGLKNTDREMITMSWNTSELVDVTNSEVLFTIVFEGANVELINQLEINSNITLAEAYTTNNEIMNINLEVEGTVENVGYALYQNSPNPFNSETAISFSLPEAMNAKITIHDVTGKIVGEYKDNYNAGLNTIEITSREIRTSGILYYTLMTDNFSATKRMVILE